MRILHTSDWHLGRSFHSVGMLAHQAVFIDHLLDVVAAEAVDLVVVSGDIYDRALPPVDAVALADDALARLAASRARVVLTSGNHDSALRLGFSARLIDAAGVHLRTSLAQVGTPVECEDAHGPVAVYGIPYLDPHAARGAWGLDTASHEAALIEAMQRIHTDLAARGTPRSVVLAHAFVAGAHPSDSERDITVGGVSRVPTSVFEGVTYTALGHLHGAHVLEEGLRYSGSPLAYSFSEAAHTKGSWLVELNGAGQVQAEFVPAPVPRPLARVRGTLAELLSHSSHQVHEGAWVEATLTDQARPSRPMEQLRQRFPHAVSLRFEGTHHAVGALPQSWAPGRSERSIATEFITTLRGSAPHQAEAELLDTAFEACCEDPEVALG